MDKSKSITGNILIIVAGLFWGSMGIFVRHLNDLGFTSIQVACLRLTMAGILFAIILLIKDPRGFKIKVQDIPLFLALGLVSILFFTCCYFTAIRLMTMSTAAILLYTSPIWVMVLAIIFLKEKITVQKIIALVLAFAGCVLVSGFGGKVTLFGILVGLGSGLGYGLYSIFGTFALKKYSTFTVTCYTFLIAGFGSGFLGQLTQLFDGLGLGLLEAGKLRLPVLHLAAGEGALGSLVEIQGSRGDAGGNALALNGDHKRILLYTS